MDTELVTPERVSEMFGKGDEHGDAFPLLYYKIFDEQCPRYMALGMSYEEYWDGDGEQCKWYRLKEKHMLQQQNYTFWLQGRYIYDAMLAVSPVFNPLSKRNEPYPYVEEPYPLTRDEAIEREENRQKKQMEKAREAFMGMASDLNRKIRKGGEANAGCDDGRIEFSDESGYGQSIERREESDGKSGEAENGNIRAEAVFECCE